MTFAQGVTVKIFNKGGHMSCGIANEPDAAVFQAHRDQIEHEDDLIGIRVSWLVAAETFLFVAYAILVNGSQYKAPGTNANELFELIPWLGVGLVVCVVISVASAMWAINRLQRNCPTHPTGFPRLTSSKWAHVTGFFGALGIPVVLLSAWLFVLTSR
jgi:hypothetical protein